LAGAYFFMRAMSCANPHIATRDNLINLLQEAR